MARPAGWCRVPSTWPPAGDERCRPHHSAAACYQIINHGTGTALDGMGNTSAGSTIGMWTPNTSTNNLWTITAT
ncbi:RICIN domain-containing protein [Sphaerisporangium rhizosphaerae]|uniref:RICIN domain-containing protein n=1 Tax=Sphaerisporangium rhizosphaerae TaxID=2269375 RepID=A0ABW2P629_9ACTN